MAGYVYCDCCSYDCMASEGEVSLCGTCEEACCLPSQSGEGFIPDADCPQNQ